MQSKPVGSQGFTDQQRKTYIGFERFNDDHNENQTSYSSENCKADSNLRLSENIRSMPYPSYSSKRQLFTPFLSAIYTEIVTNWFKEKWLIFSDKHKETFLILNSDITGYLSIQMIIDKNYFQNLKSRLIKQPECLLIRTELTNKSLIIPNEIISLENLFHKSMKNSSQGKLIVIICNLDENNSKLMFYKHSPRNSWYIFYNNQSNLLTNDQQNQLDMIFQTNFISSSQLTFPLSALCNHPIIYVYLINEN